MKNKVILILVCVLLGCLGVVNPTLAAKKASPLKTAYDIHQVTDGFYVLIGGNGLGANVGVLVQDDGVLLIESGNAREQTTQLLDKTVRQLSDKPIRYVINTHHHRDHAGGNRFFAEQGATIIAHENAKYRPEGSVAILTFSDRMTLSFGEETLELVHSLSHTFDDLLVRVEKANVVFTGDNHATNWGPSVGYFGLQGQRQVLTQAMAMADAQTLVVPGHGFLTDKQHLALFRTNSEAWAARVDAMHKKGWDVDRMIKDGLLLELFERFNGEQRELFMSDDMRSRRVGYYLSATGNLTQPDNLPDVERYLGRYQTEQGETVEVVEWYDRLFIQKQNDLVAELVKISTHDDTAEFQLNHWQPDERVTFTLDSKGKAQSLRITTEDGDYPATRWNRKAIAGHPLVKTLTHEPRPDSGIHND